MTDGTPDSVSPDEGERSTTDVCVDALTETLSMLKAAENRPGEPSLAEIMRLVRLMESQPEYAMERLRTSLHRWQEAPTPEKIRRARLQKLGHTENSLKTLSASERDTVENTIAEEIRRHFGIARLPAQRPMRPPPLSPFPL
ncbi:MAG: hypothetical protein DI589_02595 [Shinella sp.]|nr:MAG: hypothetical protein DI589_02595 [Shinella sp.]